ncbi:MAG: hypothetical protein ACKPKN_01035 [Microcystis panniformis]
MAAGFLPSIDSEQNHISTYLGFAAKSLLVVWGFTGFEVANYLIFREKVPKFPPRSLQGLPLLISKKPKDIIQQGF